MQSVACLFSKTDISHAAVKTPFQKVPNKNQIASYEKRNSTK
jgi:hypothetical protein